MSQSIFINTTDLRTISDAWRRLCQLWAEHAALFAISPTDAADHALISSAVLQANTAEELYQQLSQTAFPEELEIVPLEAGQLQRSAEAHQLVFDILLDLYETSAEPRLLQHMLEHAFILSDNLPSQLPALFQLPAVTEEVCRQAAQPHLLHASFRSLQAFDDFFNNSNWLSEDLRTRQCLKPLPQIILSFSSQPRSRVMPPALLHPSFCPEDFAVSDLLHAFQHQRCFADQLGSLSATNLQQFLDDLQSVYPSHTAPDFYKLLEYLAMRIPVAALNALLDSPIFNPTEETFQKLLSRGSVTATKKLLETFSEQFTTSLILEATAEPDGRRVLVVAGRFFDQIQDIQTASDDQIYKLVDFAVRYKTDLFLKRLLSSRSVPSDCLKPHHFRRLYNRQKTDLLQLAIDCSVENSFPGTRGYLTRTRGLQALPPASENYQELLIDTLLTQETETIPLNRISNKDRDLIRSWNAIVNSGADIQSVRATFQLPAVQAAVKAGVTITKAFVESSKDPRLMTSPAAQIL